MGANLIAAYDYLMGGCRGVRARLFLEEYSGRTRGCDQKLEHGNSIPILGKYFFSKRVVK